MKKNKRMKETIFLLYFHLTRLLNHTMVIEVIILMKKKLYKLGLI